MSLSQLSLPTQFAIFNLGPTELIIILLIVLLLFGSTKLPALAKGLGESIKEFKKASKESETTETKDAEPKKPDAPANGKSHGPN
jgi:sec-independent protein translocase protein TatA